MKKKYIPLILTAALLCGCHAESQPETTAAPTVQTTVPETEAPTEAPTTVPTEPEITIEYPTLGPMTIGGVWDESIWQEGDAISPEPGDTQYSYDASKMDDYPADEDCSDLELLNKWLDVEGLTMEDLDIRGCDQLLLTVAKAGDGVKTINTCYQRKEDGTWAAVEGLTRMDGWVGSNGVRHGRLRNTRTTPAGLWSLGLAFGIKEMPEGLKMPWRDVTSNSDWVDDVTSTYFNTWQERGDTNLTGSWDYAQAEHLSSYSFYYDYACVIRFNAPPYMIPERGSAIFLHCSNTSTGGCVALQYQDMIDTLLWLDPADCPYILITGQEKG